MSAIRLPPTPTMLLRNQNMTPVADASSPVSPAGPVKLPPLPMVKPSIASPVTPVLDSPTAGCESPSAVVQYPCIIPDAPSAPLLNEEAERKFASFQSAAHAWIKQRKWVIELMQDIIVGLNYMDQKNAKASVGGKVSAVVGAGMVVGGVLLAIPTLGASLVVAGGGLAVGGAGVATSIHANHSSWKNTKKSLIKMEEELEKDTQMSNDLIQAAKDLAQHDPNCAERLVDVKEEDPRTMLEFVMAVSGEKRKKLREKPQTGKVSSAIAAAKMGKKVFDAVNPHTCVLFHFKSMSNDVFKLYKKKPHSLVEKIQPVVEDLSEQLEVAIKNPEKEFAKMMFSTGNN